MNFPIYLDYNSTTPADPSVVAEMLPYFHENFGNASSITHTYGGRAEKAVYNGRNQVSHFIGCRPEEIIFTSGATEAVNLALKGVLKSCRDKGNHIVTVQTEHRAVLDTCLYLESNGIDVTYLPVDENGLINLCGLEESISEKTVLISVMFGNNETGVLQPVKEAVDIAHKHNLLFMSDATQAVGKIPLDVNQFDIDLMAFSGHKLYGPKGIGALYVKNEIKDDLVPVIHGGGHENGLRSGTLNVPAIVGFGKACSLFSEEQLEAEMEILQDLRTLFEDEICNLDDCFVIGENVNRLSNTSNICFEGIDADELILRTKKSLAVAAGSACTSSTIEPSHVLSAMGLSRDRASSSIRFSLGRFTSKDEITGAASIIKNEIINIRKQHKILT